MGNVIRPMDIEPRSAANVTELSQEEWADSVEMHVVWPFRRRDVHIKQLLLLRCTVCRTYHEQGPYPRGRPVTGAHIS